MSDSDNMEIQSSFISDSKEDYLTQDEETQKSGYKKILQILGSGALISIAFVDPGSISATSYIATNHGKNSFWLVILFHIIAYFYYDAALTLGGVTRMNIAEHIKSGADKKLKVMFWLLTEILLILLDIQNFIGTSCALSFFLGISTKLSLLITFLLVISIVFFHDFQQKFIELFVGLCFFITCITFGIIFFSCKEASFLDALNGLIPRIGKNQLQDGLILFGTISTPTNLILHSIIVGLNSTKRRYLISTKKQLKIYRIELGVVLIFSFIGNLFLYQIFSPFHQTIQEEIGILKSSEILENKIGEPAKVLFLIGVYASGVGCASSSAITGRYAMLGFLDLSFSKTTRNILTRLIALVPSAGIIFFTNIDKATKFVNIMVTVFLPVFLIPFSKLLQHDDLMKSYKYNLLKIVLYWFGISAVVIASLAEIYFTFDERNFFTLTFGIASCGLYFTLLIYLASEMTDNFFWKNFTVGGLSSAISRTITAPIDKVHYNLQVRIIMKESIKEEDMYKGMRDCFKRMVKAEGVRSLWIGNFRNVRSVFLPNALNFAFKDKYQRVFKQNEKNIPLSRSLHINILSGGAAGATTFAWLNFFDFAKNGLIMKRDGIKGIRYIFGKLFRGYKGIGVHFLSVILYRATYFGFYDTAKPYLKDNMVLKLTVAHTIAIVSELIFSIADPLKTNQIYEKKGGPRPKTSLSSLFKIMKGKCSSTFYRGIHPALILVLYDEAQEMLKRKNSK